MTDLLAMHAYAIFSQNIVQ